MEVTNNTRANYEALLNALKSVSGEDLASENVKDVSVVSNEQGLTITFNTTVDGKEMPIVLEMTPELDAPEGIADESVLGALLEELDGLELAAMTPEESASFAQELLSRVAEKIEEKGLQTSKIQSPDGKSAAATIFNLLEILSLIVEAGQEIKKSAAQMKAADNELQAQSYERQATKTMAMAEVAKQQGTKYMLISLSMMVASAAASIGVGVASAAKGVLAETKAAGVAADMSKNASNSNVNGVGITTSAGKAAAGKLPEGVTVDTIKSAFTNDRAVIDARGKLENTNTQLANAESLVATKQGALDTALEQHPPVEGQPEHEAVVAARAELAQAQEGLQTAKTNFAEAKAEFRDAVLNVKEKFDSEYVNSPKADQKAKYNEMVVANEIAFKTLKTETVGQGANQQNVMSALDIGKIANGCDKAFRVAKQGENHWVMAAIGTGAQFVGQLGQTLNQHWQAEVNYQAQAGQADAQIEQADATRKQKAYDEDKELASSGQDIIDSARQTMQKTYESSHQTTREIFG